MVLCNFWIFFLESCEKLLLSAVEFDENECEEGNDILELRIRYKENTSEQSTSEELRLVILRLQRIKI
jgi:hypothetical protein